MSRVDFGGVGGVCFFFLLFFFFLSSSFSPVNSHSTSATAMPFRASGWGPLKHRVVDSGPEALGSSLSPSPVCFSNHPIPDILP